MKRMPLQTSTTYHEQWFSRCLGAPTLHMKRVAASVTSQTGNMLLVIGIDSGHRCLPSEP